MDSLATAHYLLTQTYPHIKDPKLLLTIIEHLRDAIEQVITAKLEEARSQKIIPTYGTTFNGKLTAFKLHLAKKLSVTPIDFMMISEIQEIIIEHQKSSVEFRRKESFVIADENYVLKTLTYDKVKTYYERTKKLVEKLK